MNNKSAREKFKEIIQALESSGRENPAHPEIEEGMHAGDAAVGKYALMPNTVDYILNAEKRDTGVESPYSSLEGSTTEELKEAFARDKKTPELVKRTPEGLEEYLANRYADIVLNKHPDLVNAQAAWNMGHNVSPEDIAFAEENYPVMAERARKTKEMLLQDMAIAAPPKAPSRAPASEKLPPYIPNILDLLQLKTNKE